MLVAQIDDDCILGVNFLKLLNLQNIFDPIFLKPTEMAIDLKCSRINSSDIPSNMAALFREGCQFLSTSEEEDFAGLLGNSTMYFQTMLREIVNWGNMLLISKILPLLNRYLVEFHTKEGGSKKNYKGNERSRCYRGIK
ncbi:hypothetical protein ALC57_12906 [Trachymyrmex cornetzi]|uniref:Uncharacterized protein n=1 Tax=Trachymyrmex cornetzi TaxID=471704 RepID=A0A151J063_9HYME|nr:hypothetical protein ALC57_12906 [Trachymyrmex cornetzi]